MCVRGVLVLMCEHTLPYVGFVPAHTLSKVKLGSHFLNKLINSRYLSHPTHSALRGWKEKRGPFSGGALLFYAITL